MQRIACATLGLEEQGNGIGVLIGALQRVGRHHAKGSGTVDGKKLGGSLQLSEGGQKTGVADRQVCRW